RVTLDHGNAPPCGVRWTTTSADGTFFTRHKMPPASAGTSSATMTSTLMSTVRLFLGVSDEGGGMRIASGSAWSAWSACVALSLDIRVLSFGDAHPAKLLCSLSMAICNYCMAVCGAMKWLSHACPWYQIPRGVSPYVSRYMASYRCLYKYKRSRRHIGLRNFAE